AFRIEPEAAPRQETPQKHRTDERPARKPHAARSGVAVVIPSEIDVFDEPDIEQAAPPPATAPRKRSLLARLFFGAFGVLVSLAVGLWTDQLIRDLFARAEWL
ncbi:TIGR01620 family protein, partial [Mesorhizobium sp. M8A.F.Ca.ET.167.01.1.1]